ncbi:MAG: carboxypeptidase regulatory-like domain-containing protein [Gammaproteobacteria bacterium]|nr:carboxypeptidase regulatory-like domain-containing protein [Gammaproteobacteria bacterium]
MNLSKPYRKTGRKLRISEWLLVFSSLAFGATNVSSAEIFGAVSDDSAQPLAGVFVSAYLLGGSGWQVAGSDSTDSAGNYRLEGLSEGTYRLLLRDTTGAYASEWNLDALQLDGAQDIVLSAGQPTAEIDAQLDSAESISGQIDDTSNNPITGVRVIAYKDNGEGAWPEQAAVFSDSAGSFNVRGLPVGTYRLGFLDPGGQFLFEYYQDVPGLDQAQNIQVLAGVPVTNLSVELNRGSSISGSVTDTSAVVLPSIMVIAYSEATGTWLPTFNTLSDGSGQYQFENLPYGAYRLLIRDLTGSHLEEWYSDAASLEDAQTITIGAGNPGTGLDVALTPSDKDGDGYRDSEDNCPDDYNPNQENNDPDALGDICDPDDDNDLIPDSFESANALLDPLDFNDAALDPDQDDLSNLDEYRNGTELDNPDTDGDGKNDGAEVQAGSNPTVDERVVVLLILNGMLEEIPETE